MKIIKKMIGLFYLQLISGGLSIGKRRIYYTNYLSGLKILDNESWLTIKMPNHHYSVFLVNLGIHQKNLT